MAGLTRIQTRLSRAGAWQTLWRVHGDGAVICTGVIRRLVMPVCAPWVAEIHQVDIVLGGLSTARLATSVWNADL